MEKASKQHNQHVGTLLGTHFKVAASGFEVAAQGCAAIVDKGTEDSL